MIKFLNKRFPTGNFPNLVIHLYYLMISSTFCYLYYHKFINRADFYSVESSGGIYAVLDFKAIRPIQFRILIPYIFKAIKTVVFLVHPIADKPLFFLITIMLCYFILLSFYFLLNEYFKSKAINCWLASVIIYPMMWNYVIMNGTFFYMDFSVLLIIILGFYCIVSERNLWLLVVFFFGLLNHPSVGYLIPAYLLYNYRKLLSVKIISMAAVLSGMYIGTYWLMSRIFEDTPGYFVILNLWRNLELYKQLPIHIIARDAFFNFGSLHVILIIFLFSGLWKRYRGPMLYVNLVIVPYVLSVLVNFSIEEIRNYIAIIPFVVILALLFLSTFENPFLKITDKVLPVVKKNGRLKVLYVTARGGIHDYRFLNKMTADYDVLMLHYAAFGIIDEIKNIKDLKIISKKPLLKSFPLLSEYRHFKLIVDDFKPDIIHTGYVWQVGILAAIHDLHPHLSMAWGSDVLTEPDKRFIIKKIVNKVMKQADHIQCDAEFVKNKISGDYNISKEKITVFPWGIDLAEFTKRDKTESRNMLNIEQDKFTVIFNRYLDPVYGVNYMLEGYKNFAEGKADVQLLMLAYGSKLEEVKLFIKNNSLEDKIKLLGRVPNSKLPYYLSASDVYISTSLSDGTSLSLLEAMACGLGLIVSDVPAIKEWVNEKNGLVVPRKDSASVAEALNKYYNNRELINEHSRENIDIAAKRADWNKNYMILKDIYKKISIAQG